MSGVAVVKVPRAMTHTPKVSSRGGAELNPEASVFHLPSAPQATTPAAPINGFHTNVYPFMNGDVGQQYCGVCPPTSNTTGATMAVDSPVEVYPAEASSAGDPAPVKTALLPPKSSEVMAAAACTQQEGNAASCSSPLSTPQQNGEVSPESSQRSASPQSTSPLVTPPPGPAQSDALPQEPPPAPPQDKAEETGLAAAGKESSVAMAAGKEGVAAAIATGEGAAAAATVGEGAGGSETQGTQTTPAQTPTPGTPAPPTPPAHAQPQPLTRDQIKQLVAQQVEYFFSRENLSNDPYLISQMDSDQYVPVYILANCSQFKSITKDHSIIVEALKESPFVQLDEENNRVRPNYKRCIVILREIPESTPVDEIESMFKKEECPKVVSCEFVHNSSWYVTFESDEDAQKAYWYLRGVVKTFKDKPILARIKTKPMSRLGCLSVLPSYGNKGGASGEGKEGCSAPPTPGPTGLNTGPGTPAPTTSYNNPGGQRFMYSTPSSVTPNSYSYYTTPTTPMPTAFFYPNVMQWTQPGGFYDINSFLQFNGLSPQAAFKPPTNHNMRYPGSRRWVPSSQYRNSKHRDGGRYDKGDGRHNSGASQGNPHNPHPGHFQRHHLRPQAPQSPSQAVHRVPPNQAPVPSAPVPPVVPTPPPPPPPPPPHTSAGPGGISHDSFAHSDFSIASQSSLYTSFSPPMGQPSSLPGEKKEVATVTTRSSSIPNQASLPPSTSTNSNPATTTSSNNTPLNTADTHHSPSSTPAAPHLIQPPTPHGHPVHPPPPPPPHPHHRHQYPLVGPPPPPHRGGYSDNYHHPHHPHHPHHHMARDPQQARQMSRGMRRRPRGREEEGVGGVGPRGGPGQRMPGGAGGPPPPPGTDASKTNGPHHQDVTQLPPPPPPQFDLEAAAFPPLPGSDEQAPVAEEKRPAEPVVSAWGCDNTQRFSDVMKGTAKPRPTSQSSLGEKETTSDPPTPIDTTPSPALPTVPTVTPSQPPVLTPGPHPASQAPSSCATQPASIPEVSSVAPTITTTAATITAATVTAASIAATSPVTPTVVPPAASSSNGSSSSSSQNNSNSNSNSNSRVEVRTGPQRPDRRPGMGGPRERRDYHRDPREYQREGRSGGGRGGDHRTMRENARPGKENRPLPPRHTREDRMDADGWITKGPKESRAQRENREQWERAEARDSRYHLVNGDSSPPPSPKPQKTEVKVSSEETCVETTKTTPAPPLNNNDGEHKTSWAKMALASKDEMERLAAELKEKEEQEKMKQRLFTRPQPKPQEKVVVSRERDGKLMRRDGPPRDNRMVGERGTASFRPRDSARPKSPK